MRLDYILHQRFGRERLAVFDIAAFLYSSQLQQAIGKSIQPLRFPQNGERIVSVVDIKRGYKQ
ncbi:MAG: hypothetical protein GY792_25180, partial [Gammaproteobacteria bacterium]|nr:hypothetical protein [Gammaproteobacteria bacterium]